MKKIYSILSRYSLLILSVILMSFGQSYGQDAWTLLKEEAGVKVYYQIAECDSEDLIDPLEWADGDPTHQTFQLKLVNENSSDKSITFSKLTKTDDSDELETITIHSGITLLETCEAAPKMKLTKMEGDHLPTAVTEFLTSFVFTINE